MSFDILSIRSPAYRYLPIANQHQHPRMTRHFFASLLVTSLATAPTVMAQAPTRAQDSVFVRQSYTKLDRQITMRDGVKLAVAEINQAGGVLGRPLQVVERDDEAEQLVYELSARGYEVVTIVEQTKTKRLATARLRRAEDRAVFIDLLFASSGIERELAAAAVRIDDELYLDGGLTATQ